MKDFEFGKFLYNLRTKAKLSQKSLAEMLEVSNKAISKWENGDSKPAKSQALKLSKIFGISLETLIEQNNIKPPKKITKIAITGGPCAGKSTALSKLQEYFTNHGYGVLFVNEIATELILGGIAPWTMENQYDFQKAILLMQIQKEKIYEEAATKILNKDKVLIVCDRGTLDGKAFMEDYEFEKLLKECNTDITTLRDNYDAVFHLVTAANGAEEFYTTDNNKARTETVEEAIIKDNKLLSVWTGHPHLRVIDNSTNFEQKMKRLIAEISSFLGAPAPLEIERKFLIEYPDLNKLEKYPNCQKVEIIQTYLKGEKGKEIRLRQRGNNGHYTYTKNIKTQVSVGKRLEIETRLSKDEYINSLMDADTNKRQIRKTRYCYMYKNQYFEIDIYPFWNDKAIVEIELRNEDQNILFPKDFKIIKEITDDITYSNYRLADISY